MELNLRYERNVSAGRRCEQEDLKYASKEKGFHDERKTRIKTPKTKEKARARAKRLNRPNQSLVRV